MTADGRRCFTRSDDDGDELEVACLSPVKVPSCATVYLQHDATGTRNPPLTGCAFDFAPYPLTITSQFMKRLGVSIPFFDPVRSLSYPVSAQMLRDSHVVIVPYEAISHTSRHLTVPSVHLGDWREQS